MCAHRLWPTVQAIGRGLINNRTEILQQGVKAYNVQNFNSSHHGPNHQQNTPVHTHERVQWSQHVTRTVRGSFNKVVARSLHSGTVYFVKEFRDSENEHAHAVLRSLPAYSATTVEGANVADNMYYQQHPVLDLDWERCSAEEVANGFIAKSQQCLHRPMDLEDSQHSELCSVLTYRLSHLNDNQLLNVLSALTLWPPTSSTTTPNFVAIWNTLDKVCTDRMRRWDMARMFLVADHWFALRLSRISTYNFQMTRVLGKKVTSMGPSELVQYLFYANLSRKLEPFIIMRELEKRLIEVMKDISIEEVGVIAMGFFKTQTFLKNEKLIDVIIEKTVRNLETVSDATLCAILKVLRKSIPVTKWKWMHNLLESLRSQIPRLNNMVLLQVALLGNDLLVFHPQVIDSIAIRFAEGIKDLRLKDIERITFVLMLYNFIPPSRPDIFYLIADELRCTERLSEINHYPKCFVSCVVYLVTMGVMPQDLISAALQPSMLNHLSMSQHYSDMGREVNELDWSLEIEGPPKYPGYRLEPEMRNQLTKKYLARLPLAANKMLTHQERLILEVQEKLGAFLGGDDYVAASLILPHVQTPDLVFCTTMDGEPVPLPQEFKNLPSTSLKRPLTYYEDLQWNAVVIAGRNAFLRNTNSLRGNVHMKNRQLAKLGYNICLVPHMEYTKKSLRAKLSCLDRCLQEGSSLRMEGRMESALIYIKGSIAQEEEVYG